MFEERYHWVHVWAGKTGGIVIIQTTTHRPCTEHCTLTKFVWVLLSCACSAAPMQAALWLSPMGLDGPLMHVHLHSMQQCSASPTSIAHTNRRCTSLFNQPPPFKLLDLSGTSEYLTVKTAITQLSVCLNGRNLKECGQVPSTPSPCCIRQCVHSNLPSHSFGKLLLAPTEPQLLC